MNPISNHQAQIEVINGDSIIIDVREPGEFKEHHIPGALNIPSTKYDHNLFLAFQDLKICLVCQSGNRARQIQAKLVSDGFTKVTVLKTQMQDVQPTTESKGWSVDRQFRMTLGILLAIFLTLYFLEIYNGIIIPIILSTGLIVTALIDQCYMRMAIAQLPWNKGKKVPK